MLCHVRFWIPAPVFTRTGCAGNSTGRLIWVYGPAGVAHSRPPYGSSPAAEQDSLRFHRMVVRRLDHTRDQKGCDNTGDSEDSRWWQKNAPKATHLPHSF